MSSSTVAASFLSCEVALSSMFSIQMGLYGLRLKVVAAE